MDRHPKLSAFQTHRCVIAAMGVAIGVGMVASARAQAPVGVLPPERAQYSRLDAAADAYQAAEVRRMAEINNQLGLNNRMRYQSWYGSFYRGVFEPWPMVPGDIWGYPILSPVRQSIGQRSYQAGPNRWISEPVYAQDILPAQVEAGNLGVPVNSPAFVGTPLPRAAFGGNTTPGFMQPRVNSPARVELPRPRPEPADIPIPAGPREF